MLTSPVRDEFIVAPLSPTQAVCERNALCKILGYSLVCAHDEFTVQVYITVARKVYSLLLKCAPRAPQRFDVWRPFFLLDDRQTEVEISVRIIRLCVRESNYKVPPFSFHLSR